MLAFGGRSADRRLAGKFVAIGAVPGGRSMSISRARKVIDWHKQRGADLARELADLPEGRYVLVPENELAADDELSAEEADGLIEALASLDRGEGLHGQDVLAEMRARTESGR